MDFGVWTSAFALGICCSLHLSIASVALIVLAMSIFCVMFDVIFMI